MASSVRKTFFLERYIPGSSLTPAGVDGEWWRVAEAASLDELSNLFYPGYKHRVGVRVVTEEFLSLDNEGVTCG